MSVLPKQVSRATPGIGRSSRATTPARPTAASPSSTTPTTERQHRPRGWRALVVRLLARLYRIERRSLRSILLRVFRKVEGDKVEFYSLVLRDLFREHHGVEIGMFSHGGCFVPTAFPAGTTVGRYCSIAGTVRVFSRNHPTNLRSTHGMPFNPEFGLTSHYLAPKTDLTIESDVWIGHNAVLLPGTRKIGVGAVIGAGSVVSKEVPPYAIVVGNPARVVRYRFPPEIIAELIESRWWELDCREIADDIEAFQSPLHGGEIR